MRADGLEMIPMKIFVSEVDKILLSDPTFEALLEAASDVHHRYKPKEVYHIIRCVSPAFLLKTKGGRVHAASAAASVSALLKKYKLLKARCDGHKDHQVFHNLICQLILEDDGTNPANLRGGDTFLDLNEDERIIIEKGHLRFVICNFTYIIHGATEWDWNRGLYSIYMNRPLLKWSHQWRVVRYDGHNAWVVPRCEAEIKQLCAEFEKLEKNGHVNWSRQ